MEGVQGNIGLGGTDLAAASVKRFHTVSHPEGRRGSDDGDRLPDGQLDYSGGLTRRLQTSRGGSLKIKDSWRRDDKSIPLSEYVDERDDDVVAVGSNGQASSLQRHGSLPGRTPAAGSTSLSRQGSQRSTQHPTIAEVAQFDSAANTNLGRSSSLKHIMDQQDWRTRVSGGITANNTSKNLSDSFHGLVGGVHQRSHSISSPTSGGAVQDLGTAFQKTHLSDLYKSNSVRSTYSTFGQSHDPSKRTTGHAHTRSMFSLSPPQSSTFSQAGSQLGWLQDDAADPLSPTAAGDIHSHIGHGQLEHQDTDSETAAAILKRHASLQQGYGRSQRVADRLARSQAVLAVENRINSASRSPPHSHALTETPISPIAKSAWSHDVNTSDGDGWEEFSRQRQHDLTSGDHQNAQARVQLKDMDPDQQARLLRVMKTLQSDDRSSANHTPSSQYEADQFRNYSMNSPRTSTNHRTRPSVPVVDLSADLDDPLHHQPDLSSGPRQSDETSTVPTLQGGYPATLGYTNQPGSVYPLGYPQAHYASYTTPQPYGYTTGTPQPQTYSTLAPSLPGIHQGLNAHPSFGVSNVPYDHSTRHLYNFSPQQPQHQPLLHHHRQPSPQPPHTQRGYGHHAGTVQQPAPPVAIPKDIAQAAEREVKEMIERRGLNPTTFDCEVPDAKYFVIKSFTEDDVQKSLKHEIWSSTNFGNQRLDRSFHEAKGPVYLFFSVNGSGHFCGMAQLLSGVNYNESSTVWAQDKWKGIMKLRWIFVKDVPNSVLRHIRLMNTQEQKPITNSRDTQELLRDAGVETMRIMTAFREKTSLLNDYGYYEMQAAEKAKQAAAEATRSDQAPPPSSMGDTVPHQHTTVGGRGGGGVGGSDVRPPIIVPTVVHPTQQSGMVKTFNPTGPPSMTTNKRFAVTSRRQF